MIITEVIFLFLFPALVIWLTKRFRRLGKIGAIALCYAFGFLFSALPIPYDKGLAQTVASVLVAIAIPLILFGFDVSGVRRLAKKTLVAFGLMILSVIAVSAAAAFFAKGQGSTEASALAGMATGLYIGGTPNLFAVGNALLGDATVISLANVADSLVGGIWILLVFGIVHKLYRRVLGNGMPDGTDSAAQETAATEAGNALADEYDYKAIPRDKKSLLKLFGVFCLALLCLGAGVLLEILVNGNMDGSLYIMITVSLLGVLVSFIRPVREVRGTYQVGQYFILVFSLGLGMSIDWSKMAAEIFPTLAFFAGVQMASIVLHFLLCKLFRIDGGTALVTCIAGIYGPPFIAPTANAYGDRSLILPGVICGTLGLAFGNLIGIGLGGLLGLIL